MTPERPSSEQVHKNKVAGVLRLLADMQHRKLQRTGMHSPPYEEIQLVGMTRGNEEDLIYHVWQFAHDALTQHSHTSAHFDALATCYGYNGQQQSEEKALSILKESLHETFGEPFLSNPMIAYGLAKQTFNGIIDRLVDEAIVPDQGNANRHFQIVQSILANHSAK